MRIFRKLLSEKAQANLFLRYFALTKVPMIFYSRASIVEISTEKVVLKLPLRRRNKNHLNSMYFGALNIGADVCGGVIAMLRLQSSRQKYSFSFKSFKADYLKRPEGDTYFTCTQGKEIGRFIEKVSQSDERMEMPIQVTATVPDKLGDEPVAEFELVISVRRKV